jgi:hypothetical protein
MRTPKGGKRRLHHFRSIQMLLFRKKDLPEDIKIRARAAASEILGALSPEGQKMYAKIIYSSPEGPDGQDDWTRGEKLAGKALEAMGEFRELMDHLKEKIRPSNL